MDAWLKMSAAELGRGIGDLRIDPVALAEAFLEAIDTHPYGDRIYVRPTRQRALDEAMAARARAQSGGRRGALDGVPVSWKDLVDTAGIETEAGSALLKGRVPGADAEMLRNATAAGLVCLGKTHMSELAFSGLGFNPVTASPPCVNDPEAVSGGSSSGAATSVAYGLAPAAIGSDTGGSVRLPAAWNDLVGLKTSHGRLSLQGIVPLCPRFDTIGPLSRSVEDAALLLAVLEGGKPADLTGATLAGRRLMVLETVALEEIRAEPLAGFESAVERLASAGAVIERRKLPVVAEALALSPLLYAPEAYGTWKDAIEAQPELMYPAILQRFQGGLEVSGPDYVAAWEELEDLRARYLAETAGFDAVLVPTVPSLPPKIAEVGADVAFFNAENLLALRNTRIGNLLGLCGLTLPTGHPGTGVSFLAPPMREEALLRLGAAAEAALP
ncbi:amidase [Tropicimonas sp. IMCC6043]|uniref:amidase n=1 Tax=Tropicimonas sp. IMCC6043 TaxID=2510645 RepID=UPI00101E195B|nr:amidase [Tropicimonas sp. IMCC6043]RYH09121.1 amidase [Tropicimonas sp. IMCC6043]